MVAHCRGAGLVLLAAGCLALTAATSSVAPEIKDQGKFFSDEAIKKANEAIRHLALKYDRDVLIETYPTPPADQLDKFKELDAKERQTFFNKWALERAQFRVVRGLYILLCKEPHAIYIKVSPNSRKVFTDEFCDQLRLEMGKEFRKDRFDEGLTAGLHFIEERLAKDKDK